MDTFSLVRGDRTFDVKADSIDDANAKLDAHLAQGTTPTTQDQSTPTPAPSQTPQSFPLVRGQRTFNVTANSADEANQKLDAHLATEQKNALDVIKSGVSAEHPQGQTALDSTLEDAGQKLTAAGRGAVGGIVGIPSLITDLIGHGIQAMKDKGLLPNEVPTPNTQEASDFLLKSLGMPTGDETRGSRFIGDVSSALSGQGLTKKVSDVVNSASQTVGPGGVTQRVLNELAAGQKAQTVGNVAGTTVTSQANEEGGNPWIDMGLGTLTGILASRGIGNWGDVEKAIANGQIKSEDRQFLLSMAQKYPLLTQAAFPIKSGLGKYAQKVSGSIPIIGTADQVEKQAAGVQSALQDTLDNTPTGTKQAAVADLTANRGSRIGDLKAQKQSILDQASAPVDVNATVDTGGGPVPGNPKIKPGKEAGPATGPIGGPDTISVDAQVPGNAGTKVQPALDQIDVLKQRMAGANNPAVFGPYMKRLDDLSTALKNSDPNGIELNRQVLQDIYQDPQLGNVGKALSGMSRSLYGSVADSLRQTVANKLGPEVGDKFAQINQQLQNNVQDLKLAPFKSALNSGQTNLNRVDSLMNYVENQNDYGAAKNMLKDLSPEGKLNMGDAILTRWMQKAGLGADKDVSAINPDAMVAELRKTYGPAGLFFSPEQTTQAKGLLQYVKAVQTSKSGDVNWSNPLHWVSGVAAVPFMRVYNSKMVRNMLIRLHDMNPKDPAYQNTVQQLTDTFQNGMNNQGDNNAN